MGSSRKERGWAMAVLAECPMGHRRQSIRSKRCMSKNGKRGGADLEKAKRSGKVKYWIAYRLPGGKQRFEKLTGERATSIEYARDAEAKRKVQRRENRIFDIKPESKMTFQEGTAGTALEITLKSQCPLFVSESRCGPDLPRSELRGVWNLT